MKVTGFINYYKTFCIVSCPLNKAAESWRAYHGLHFLNEGGDFHINCKYSNVLTGPAIDYHAKNGYDEYSFHKGIKVYYKECFKSLQNVAKKHVKETGEYSYKISTCLPKLPPVKVILILVVLNLTRQEQRMILVLFLTTKVLQKRKMTDLHLPNLLK